MTIRPSLLIPILAGLMLAAPPAEAQVPITGARPAPTPAPAPTAAPDAPANPGDAPRSSKPASGGDADARLADAAETYKFAVGVVVIVVPGRGAIPFGTAWAIEPRLFATNAHVVKLLQDLAKQAPGAPFYVAINQRPDKRLRIVGSSIHPEYGTPAVRFDGKRGMSGFDLGLLRTEDAAPAHFTLAPRRELQGLRSGVRVAFLGFPMESLINDNIDAQMPIATMQSGIVTAVSDRFLGDTGFDNNRLIRHNLPAAGGASGSPIFTPDGRVVAILWGGNVDVRLAATADGKVTELRQPSAAQVNFAERIDSLAGVPRP